VPIDLTHMALGDGGGAAVEPTEAATALAGEQHRAPLDRLVPDATNPNWLVAELAVPAAVGGWFIREVGLIDGDGDLVAYGNFPETYKPVLADGSSRDLVARMLVEVTSTAAVILQLDPAVIMASQTNVAAQVSDHATSGDHPAAAHDAQGMVELAEIAEVREGTDHSRAVTPAGVAAAIAAKTGRARRYFFGS
jgi:phage-related tail fiber protein